jgi:WD40 repeat protein
MAISSKGEVALLEGQQAKQRRMLRQDANVFSVAISPDEQMVATGANDNIVRLFSAKSGELKAQWKGHGRGEIFLPSAIYSLAFSPDGKRVASGGHDGRVIVWDVETGKTLLKAEIRSQPIVQSVVFSPDSKLVAGGFTGAGDNHGVCVWKVPSMPESDPGSE